MNATKIIELNTHSLSSSLVSMVKEEEEEEEEKKFLA